MFTVIGEAIVDLVPAGGRRYDARPGGSPLNVAVGLARLGRPVAMMARLSGAGFGPVLREHARSAGLDLSAAPSATEPATVAVVDLDEQGRATYDFYRTGTADWQWTDAELAALPAGTRVLHTGSLAAWLPPGAAGIAALVERVRDRMLISYDPNVRPALLGTPAAARPLIERSVAAAHLVKVSEDDLAWLYPDTEPEVVLRRWAAAGPTVVVLTRGPAGAVGLTSAGDRVEVAAPELVLADTVGAGDAFTAGLLDGLTDHSGLTGLAARPDELGAVLARAVLVATLTCERPGADPPSAAELAAAAGRLLPPRR